MTRYVYISVAGAGKIAIFTQDQATGKLTHKEDVALDGPGPMAVSPTQPVLYACMRAVPAIASLRIDPSTGSLTSIGSAGMDEGPAMISTDRTGRFLFGAYYGSGSISVNPIDDDGIAGDPSIQRESTDERAHYIQADDSNKFVIVPHVLPGNAIFVFNLDADTGKLTAAGPPVKPPEGEGPRHFCFHPNQKFIFTANEDSSTVTSYRFDNQSGALSQVQTVSTLPPEGYSPGPEPNSCSQIRITPNGKFLYAPNRGHDSVACFRVGDEGGLDTIGYAPARRHVRGTAMDPDGKYLYTTGTQSGNMESYTISQQTGALEPLEIIDVGESPMWVEIVDQGLNHD